MTTQVLNMNITSIPYVRGTGLAIAATLVIGMHVGTGGAETLSYYNQRSGMGYPLTAIRRPIERVVLNALRDPSGDLEHIKKTLRISVTSLAKILGVSRQAVYDWQSGKPIADENAERLADLARAADVFVEANIEPSAQLFRRTILSGKGLLDIVQDGSSAESTARKLVDILRSEARQRERLQVRLATRTSVDYSDAGIPMLDEES